MKFEITIQHIPQGWQWMVKAGGMGFGSIEPTRELANVRANDFCHAFSYGFRAGVDAAMKHAQEVWG